MNVCGGDEKKEGGKGEREREREKKQDIGTGKVGMGGAEPPYNGESNDLMK